MEIWHLFTFLAGIAQAFNQPVRRTIVLDLVPMGWAPNTAVLSSADFNFVRAPVVMDIIPPILPIPSFMWLVPIFAKGGMLAGADANL